jgi:UDP-N-acetyl-D-glucosamine dehydrogenase
VAKALYGTIIDTLVPVSSTDAAEMVKLLENTFRAVNIGLVNEVALMSRKLGVDVWEVIRAAAIEALRLHALLPGAGPRRPLHPHRPALPLVADAQPQVPGALHRAGRHHQQRHARRGGAAGARGAEPASKAVNGSKILVAGVAYKRDVSDYRESPAFDVIHGLRTLGAERELPRPARARGRRARDGDEIGELLGDALRRVRRGGDHHRSQRRRLRADAREAPLLVDTRDALRNVEGDHSKVLRL